MSFYLFMCLWAAGTLALLFAFNLIPRNDR